MEPAPSISDFTVIRRIGGGGYGEVWLGRSVTGVLRAIKIIRRDRFEDDRPFFRELDGITRFQQAVRDQPRQLALLHVGRDDSAGVFYYVMELADDAATGTEIDPERYVPLTLKELIARRHFLPTSDCLRIAAELATALGDLHRVGLLHRDVKPSNIILVDGHAKLADIGLVASSDFTVSSVGTPDYAAPEGTGSARADLYSLGKVIYELATGLHASRFPELPADAAERSDAAELMELNEILLRTCHHDPAQRYPDAAALLGDLRFAQAGRSVQELNRTRRQLRTLSWFAAAAGAVALVIIVVLGVRNYASLRALAAQETAFRRAAEANERLASYTSDLHFAQLAFSVADIGAARTALRRQMPDTAQVDLRGVEWFALWNDTAGDESQLLGSVGAPAITALALGADGDTTLAIERASPNRLAWLNLHTGRREIIADDCFGLVAYDSVAQRAVVTNSALELSVIDLATRHRRPQGSHGIPLDQSRREQTVLLTGPAPDNTSLQGWDFDQASPRFTVAANSLHPGAAIATAALSLDGRRLACAIYWDDGANDRFEIVVRDLVAGTELARINHPNWVGRLRFAPDGSRLAIVRLTDVALVDLTRSTELISLCRATGDEVIAFSPDSRTLAVGSEHGRLQLWSVSHFTQLAELRGHEAAVLCIDWSADGRYLVSGSMDGTVRIWEPDRPARRRTRSDLWADLMGGIVFSADGAAIVATDAAGRGTALDTTSLQPVHSMPEVFHPLAVSNDGTLLALSPERHLVRSHLTSTETELTPLTLAGRPAVTAFSVSSNQAFSAFAHEGGEITVWDLRTPSTRAVDALPTAGVESIAISNDGRWLAIGDWTGALSIIDLDTHLREILPGDNVRETSLLFSANDTLLVAGTERGHLVIWDHRARSVVAHMQAHSAAIRHLVFTPDGSRLLSGGAEGMIVVWGTNHRRWLAAWSIDSAGGQTSHGIYLLAMPPNGAWLAALTDQGQLQVWDCRIHPPKHQ